MKQWNSCRWRAVALAGALMVPAMMAPHVAHAQNINMTGNYNGYEMLATRIETIFGNGCTAVTQPSGAGLHVTEASFNKGPGAGTKLRVTHSAVSGELSIDVGSPQPARVKVPADVTISVDWLNAQACSLLQDSIDAIAVDELGWQHGVFRVRSVAGAAARGLRELSNDVQEVRAEFPSVSIRTAVPAATGRRTDAASEIGWESTVTAADTRKLVGRVKLLKHKKAVAFTFPGLTPDTVITESNVGHAFPFEPNAAWGTIQAFAFYTSLVRQREVKENVAAAGSVRGVEGKKAAAARPKGKLKPAREGDGCTGLWWLNGSLFEACCNSHDRCWTIYSCDMGAWMLWDMWWMCAACNLAVVHCFVGTACYYLGAIGCV